MTDRPKTPTWATLVGVLGICFGALGTLSGAYGVLTPAMLSMQRELIGTMHQSMPAGNGAQSGTAAPAGGTLLSNPEAFVERLLTVPRWYVRWSVVNGVAQLLLGIAYLLSALFLLLMRRRAPGLFIAVAGASLVRNMIAIGVAVFTASLLAYWALGSALCGALVDLALLVTVALADKSAYREPAPAA